MRVSQVVANSPSQGAPASLAIEAPGTREQTVRVPVSLTGLKPGEKVRIHLVVEVEAVRE